MGGGGGTFLTVVEAMVTALCVCGGGGGGTFLTVVEAKGTALWGGGGGRHLPGRVHYIRLYR